MRFDAFYLVEPRGALEAHLQGLLPGDLVELLCDPTVLRNSEGGRTAWTAVEHSLVVKLCYLAILRDYDLLSADSGFSRVFGTAALSAHLFDQWWTLRRFDIDEDTAGLKRELASYKVEATGNPIVDDWITSFKNSR